MAHDEWTDPHRLPVDTAIDLGGGVCASWARPWAETNLDGVRRPMIWHWCDRSLIIPTRDESQPVGSKDNRLPEWYEPQWVAAGCRGHELVSADPLHLEPSLLWPDCCGKHGWIRQGAWVAC